MDKNKIRVIDIPSLYITFISLIMFFTCLKMFINYIIIIFIDVHSILRHNYMDIDLFILDESNN